MHCQVDEALCQVSIISDSWTIRISNFRNQKVHPILQLLESGKSNTYEHGIDYILLKYWQTWPAATHLSSLCDFQQEVNLIPSIILWWTDLILPPKSEHISCWSRGIRDAWEKLREHTERLFLSMHITTPHYFQSPPIKLLGSFEIFHFLYLPYTYDFQLIFSSIHQNILSHFNVPEPLASSTNTSPS